MNINENLIRELIQRARAFDAKEDVHDASGDPDSAEAVDLMRSRRSDPDRQEIIDEIEGLHEDAQAELVALYWIGRGDYEATAFAEAIAEAKARKTGPTSRYLVGSPLLGDYLETGIDAVLEAGSGDDV